ncbi:sensor histidine kinase [Thermosipho atlanticus]|uniref:histidine kinase n=1 Tax=Thermosipho atlanticus DSM 15807 TaxID=1123380 RepID=A0A1M5TKJ4_9BACT|nr:ATP-binding protein [Thermosipho atlanticus]SHH51224.1 two-component system, OmpR family, sensor kinase [Thermosipho atlanticus DSM 15807]
MFNFEVFDFFDEIVILLEKLKIKRRNKLAEKYGINESIEIFSVFTFDKIDELVEHIFSEKDFKIRTKMYFFQISQTRDVVLSYNSSSNLLIIKDVTEIERLKEAKINFTTAVSHELFNPLSVIKANVYLLLDNKETVETALREIEKSVKRMERIIKQLKILSMLELGLYMPKYNEIDIEKVLKEVIEDLNMKIKAKSITIEKKIVQRYFRADGFLIYTILKNLISNAVKYSYKNSTVKIETIDNMIIIEDRGIGIKKEELEKVTERFYRTKDAIKMATGSGLGLSVVKHICSICNYKLKIESNYMMGTKVIVVLNT